MIYSVLNRVEFEKLKGIQNATVSFSSHLTAIMGVNGAGKTTIIHALACMFQPKKNGKGDNFHFPNFFVPNTDALWTGSKFTSFFSVHDTLKEDEVKDVERTYEKKQIRWSPRYENRPRRNTYYIGIDTCLPEIERTNASSMIHYETKLKEDKISNKVVSDAAFILNKPYSALTGNKYTNRELIGVKRNDGLKYSSLSMGTGEQRIIKILNTIHSAEFGSLVLIDEIDLLLHVSALRKLIECIYRIADRKKIQIVFTTHSKSMMELTEYVSIQYISQSRGTGFTEVCNRISSDLLYGFTGQVLRPMTIFVEDNFSKAIVKSIAKQVNVLSKVNILTFGSCSNAYTIAADKVIEGVNTDNILIVLDGDVDQTVAEKKEKMEKHLAGSESDHNEKVDRAVACITQYELPEGFSPEQFMHKLLLETTSDDMELARIASDIVAVWDKHEWVYRIAERINEDEAITAREIIALISESEAWKEYTKPIREWLLDRKDI